MNVYYRNLEGKFGCSRVEGAQDHEEAILLVKEDLINTGEGYNLPVLAVIK